MADPNGDLSKLLGPKAPGQDQVMVGLPVGPNGEQRIMPWQAGLIWQLDQIRLLLGQLVQTQKFPDYNQVPDGSS